MANSALDAFLDNVSNTAEMNEVKLVCPEVELAQLTVKDVNVNTGIIGRGEREGQPWFGISLAYVVDNDEVREYMKRDEVVVYGNMMFLTVKDNVIDKDDNPELARTLKALGVEGGELSNRDLIDSMKGCQCVGNIVHEIIPDKPEGDNIAARVSMIANIEDVE